MKNLSREQKVEYVKTLIANGANAKVANYRKSAIVNGNFAKGGEVVVTVIKGKEETSNVAEHGDFIVDGKLGEKYIIRKNDFSSLYVKVDGGYQKAPLTGFVTVPEDVAVEAPWGEIQKISAGGALVVSENPDDIYGIDAEALAKTYVEVK